MPEAPTTDDILAKAAEYVAITQPQLDKHAADKQSFDTQLQRTAGVLADRGMIRRDKVNDFVDKVAENPRNVLLFLEKMAHLVGADQMGAPSSEIEKVAADSADPFVRAYCPELMPADNGLVD
jgi:hypothetical protein